MRDEILSYFDADGFMGRRPNPGLGEEGNPLLETGTAYALLRLWARNEPGDRERFEKPIDSLQSRFGLWNKKPRTEDEITKDDLYGVVAGSIALDSTLHREIYNYGRISGWVMSNTGRLYPSAFARPWDIAFYELAAGARPSLWGLALLIGAIVLDALIKKPNDPSSKRLTWLCLFAVFGKSFSVDLAGRFWSWRIKKRYGGMQGVFRAFHGEGHVFTKYAVDLW